MMVLQKGEGESVKSLATIQENVKSSATEIAHTTEEDRSSYKKKVLLNVNVGEAAASKMLASNGKSAQESGKKARAKHLDRCSLMPERKKTRRKPLKELLLMETQRKTVRTGKRAAEVL